MSAKVTPIGTLRPGDIVAGRYRVERFLQRELHEESYAVRTIPDGRPLLLKLIAWPSGPPELSPAELESWKLHVSRLVQLRHPSLSQTYELIAIDGDGRTCLIREPVELEGQTLQEFLHGLGRPLSEQEVLQLATLIGEALDAAHRQELFHLSLSLRRVIVMPEQGVFRIKLTDFGLYPPSLAARFAEPGYLAPEVLSAQPVDPRSDQFSLAVILYELLSGQPAFIGGEDEPREVVVQRVLAEDPLPLLLSQKVELALQRALSRSRGVRYPHIRDFISALGGDVRAFSPPTQTAPVVSRTRSPVESWPRLWLPMVQGALWALCGLGLLLGGKKILWDRKPPVYVDLGHDLEEQSDAAEPIRAAVEDPSDGFLEEPDASTLEPRRDAQALSDAGFPAAAKLAQVKPQPVKVSQGSQASLGPAKTPAVRRDGGLGEPDRAHPPLATVDAHSEPVVTAVQIDVMSQDGKLLPAQENGLRTCLRLVRRPPLPYRVVLENIGGTLYVSPRGTTDEFQTSSDFRDCLKLRISGIVIPKVVTLSGKAKGKTSP